MTKFLGQSLLHPPPDFSNTFHGYPALTVPANIQPSMFFHPAPPRPSDICECKTSSTGHYFTQLANSLRFSFPLRPYSRAPGCLKHELLYAEAGPGVKERTADSQLLNKINPHSKTVPALRIPERAEGAGQQNLDNFSADPDFSNCIRIRAYQLADVERADHLLFAPAREPNQSFLSVLGILNPTLFYLLSSAGT